ncbi:MAG: hypothetical protein AB1420_03050 [Bacillota bacterium]
MNEYYFNENSATAYKISPISTSYVYGKDKNKPTAILIHTNVKITNFKKEKIRRILSQAYPIDGYDAETAKNNFYANVLAKVLMDAKKITEEEYEAIKEKVERP